MAFWVEIAAVITKLVAELTAEARDASTVVGALPAVTAGVRSIQKAIFLVVEIATRLERELTKHSTEINYLNKKIANNDAFPNGRWPRSTTTDLSDGSLTDGDDTDWHLRY